MTRPLPLPLILSLALANCGLVGCHRGDNPQFFRAGKAPKSAPRLVEARFIDVDDDGIDEDDVIVKTVTSSGASVSMETSALRRRW